MKTVDYLLEALKYHGGRNDGFRDRRFVNSDNHTDQPIGIKLAEDDYVRVRYDAQYLGGGDYALDCEQTIED